MQMYHGQEQRRKQRDFDNHYRREIFQKKKGKYVSEQKRFNGRGNK